MDANNELNWLLARAERPQMLLSRAQMESFDLLNSAFQGAFEARSQDNSDTNNVPKDRRL